MKRLIILLLVLSISVSGCIQDTSKAVKNVKIGHQRSDLHSALFVAEKTGLFEKYGINATLIEFTGGPVEMQALGAGEIDIGYVGTAPALTYMDKTYKDERVSAHIITGAQTGGIGIIVGKDSNIQKIRDLKGKKVGVLAIGSIQDIMLRDALAKEGILGDVDILAINLASIPQAVASGQVDAGFTAQPFVSEAVVKGYGRVLAWAEDLPVGSKNMFINVLVARDGFARNNPELVKDLLKIHIEATEYIKNNPEKAAEIASAKLGTSLEVEKESIKHIGFSSTPSQENIESVLVFADALKGAGTIKNSLTRDDVFDLRYIR